MQAGLARLVHYLGEAGLEFSTSEIIDFYQALDLTGLSYDQVESALLCTLAKDKESYLALPALLKSFILSIQAESGKVIPPPVDLQAVSQNPPRLSAEDFNNRLALIKDTIRNELTQLKTNPGGAGKGLPVSRGQITSPGLKTAAPAHGQPVKDFERPVLTRLWQLDLATATSDQLHDLGKIIISLGSKLVATKGYAKKPAASGSVDIRRTVRKAIAGGGVPLVIKKEKRVPAKPEIVVLCDLSGSVAPYSQFFLQVLLGLQHRFKSVRSFAFIDRVEEITDIIKANCQQGDISAQSLVWELKISATGFSNYGRVWQQFDEQFLPALNQQTSLIILGDARNNWQPDGVDYFRNLTQQCRKVIWLNPLGRDKWKAEDCILDTYAVYCSCVFPCANAAQLTEAIKKII